MPEVLLEGLEQAQVEEFDRNGYLVMRGLFAPEEVAEIRDTFMAQTAEGTVPGLSETSPDYRPDDPLARYPRMMHPHRHPDLPVGPLSLRYLLDPRVETILRALFRDEPLAAQTMFYFKPAGARGQDLHQDNFYLRVFPGTCLAAWAAIDDADEENGGLVVVPGSHEMEIACPEQADRSRFFTTHHVPVPPGLSERPLSLAAGDVLFFNGSLIHGSYPNTSPDRFRRAFIAHYVPRNCLEVSHGYRPLLDFSGQEVAKAGASGGGPCGAVPEAKSPH